MCDRIGDHWIGVFQGDTQFYSAVYWDLLTEMWRSGGPVRKTEALRFMKAVKSAHTAGRYIESAVLKGFLIESSNPEDARSKLVTLSPEMRRQLDVFFDAAIRELQRSNETIETDT